MKKFFWISCWLISTALLGCGGGGGTSSTPGSTPTQPFVMQTSVFSPVTGQALMTQSTAASLNHPRLMTFDGTYLYVATGVDNSIVRIDANGIQTTMTGFNGPVGLAIHNGVIYATQTGGLYQLSIPALTNGASVAVTPSIVTNNTCGNCFGLLFNGNVAYISDGSSTLKTFDASNNGWQQISLSSAAYGLALKNGYLVATDYNQTVNGYNVSSITSTWTSVDQKTISGQPYGVAIASNGDIYVSSYASNTVTRIHAGVVDSAPYLDSSKVCHPLGLTINETTQSLYVASERSAVGCGLSGQSTGYILRASIDLTP